MYFSVAMHPLDLWFISVLSDHCFAQMEHQQKESISQPPAPV